MADETTGYDPQITVEKGAKGFLIHLASLVGGVVLLALSDPDALVMLLTASGVSPYLAAALIPVIGAAIEAARNYTKHRNDWDGNDWPPISRPLPPPPPPPEARNEEP